MAIRTVQPAQRTVRKTAVFGLTGVAALVSLAACCCVRTGPAQVSAGARFPACGERAAPHDEVDDDFGAVVTSSLDLLAGGHEPVVVARVYLIEGSFSDYDIKSQPDLATRAVVSGVLWAEGEWVSVFGERKGCSLSLFSAAVVMGDSDRNAPWDMLMSNLVSLNRNALPGESTLELTLEPLGGATPPLRLSVTGVGAGLQCALARATRCRAGLTDDPTVDVITRRWTGVFLDSYDADRPMRMRLEVRTVVPRDGGPPVTIGALTVRPSVRRFEGSMPPGCPWRDRRQLGVALRRLSESGIDWQAGVWDARAQAILSESAGRTVTEHEFHDTLMQLFGSFASAATIMCPLLEVQHVPVLKVIAEGGCWFDGVVWVPGDQSESGRFHRFLVQRLHAPAADGSSTVDFHQGRIREAELQHLQLQVEMTANPRQALHREPVRAEPGSADSRRCTP